MFVFLIVALGGLWVAYLVDDRVRTKVDYVVSFVTPYAVAARDWLTWTYDQGRALVAKLRGK